MLGIAHRSRAETAASSVASAADEAALVAAAQAEPRAFAPLYERYVAVVYRYCYHRLGTREAAEDATSLVFARALAALPRYRPSGRDGAFRSWLFAIAHNAVADGHRRARPTASLATAETLATPEAGPEARTILAHEAAALHRLLAGLPDDQRRVMELRLSGLDSPAVAAILGRTPGAIRSLQFRAVERLRALLADESAKEGRP